jgi:DNA-directed RNA polymerase subunit L
MFFDNFNYDQEENELDFFVYNVPTAIINSIRKVIISEYKTHAIDEVNFITNTSVIHNDFLRHRLHMLPLKTDEYCELELCMTNHTDEIIDIYSQSLTVKRGMCDFEKDVLLLKLRPGESIDLVAKTNYDCGKINAKYRPTSISYFKINKCIKISDELRDRKDELKQYFKENYDLKEQTLINDELFLGYTTDIRSGTNLILRLCKELNINDESYLQITDFNYNKMPTYTFFIESYYFDPKTIINESIKIILNKLDDFMNNDMEIEEHYINNNHHIDFYIQNERGLVGDILSYMISLNKNIKFCNFYHEHPLNNYILLKLVMNDSNDDNYLQYFKDGFLQLIETYKNLQSNFQ